MKGYLTQNYGLLITLLPSFGNIFRGGNRDG